MNASNVATPKIPTIEARPAPEKVSDQIALWLASDGDKTLGGLIDMFEEKSFALIFILLLGGSGVAATDRRRYACVRDHRDPGRASTGSRARQDLVARALAQTELRKLLRPRDGHRHRPAGESAEASSVRPATARLSISAGCGCFRPRCRSSSRQRSSTTAFATIRSPNSTACSGSTTTTRSSTGSCSRGAPRSCLGYGRSPHRATPPVIRASSSSYRTAAVTSYPSTPAT